MELRYAAILHVQEQKAESKCPMLCRRQDGEKVLGTGGGSPLEMLSVLAFAGAMRNGHICAANFFCPETWW